MFKLGSTRVTGIPSLKLFELKRSRISMETEQCMEVKSSTKMKGRPNQQCPLSLQLLPNIAEFKQHVVSHAKEKAFKCNPGGFETASQKIYQRHIDKNHIDKSVRGKRLKFKCTFCTYGTYQLDLLRRHIAIHVNERGFPCKFPGFKA